MDSAVTSTRIGRESACSARSAIASDGLAFFPRRVAATVRPRFFAPASSAMSAVEKPPGRKEKPPRSITAERRSFPRDARSSPASVRPTDPNPSRTTSAGCFATAAPPPIFESWKASWMRRCASGAWASETTKEMFSSDEPCAMATTLIPPAASAEKTRDAMPGVPAIPRPTTEIVESPARSSTPSISRRAISSANASSRLRRASLALACGTERQIECSEEAWEINETEIPSRWSAANVRAAMPGTPSMPLPVTVRRAWPEIADSALTG